MISPSLPQPASFNDWLAYIEALHPASIAMGLERIEQVRLRLGLDPRYTIITVGGTNGKGSACAMLERIYLQAGYRVACYSSPHLLRYNERVRIDGVEADDAALSAAFSAVEAARGDTPLTYFEFGTLATVWLFAQSGIDVAILEVGLGGRLDAVNLFEPACSIVTSIDFDHMDFLGNSRESIGYEKAGIFRSGIPAICGDPQPPASLIQRAADIGADYRQIQHDFGFRQHGQAWDYYAEQKTYLHLPLPALTGNFQLYNAACVLTAIESLQAVLPVSAAVIADGLRAVRLAGRFQQYRSRPQVILDVAHNPHAAQALADNLQRSRPDGRTLAVFAMLADKDITGVVDAIYAQIDEWYISGIGHPRGATALQLADIIRTRTPAASLQSFTDVTFAYRQACLDARENDRIVVFGSFFTVSDVMRATGDQPDNQDL